MRKTVSLLLAACLLNTSAMAAENDWTGWYVGGHVGHANGDSEANVSLGGQWSAESQALRDDVVGNWSTDLDSSGAAYGAQVGYQYQFQNSLVLGVELDYSQLNLDDARASGPTPSAPFPSLSYDYSNGIELDDMASLRAKLGYAMNRHLLYVTAGWSQVAVDASAGITSNGGYRKLGTESETLDGTTWGAGYEFDFGNQWSLRAEYLRTRADDLRFDTDYLAGSTFTSPVYTESVRQELDLDVARVGVNFRF